MNLSQTDPQRKGRVVKDHQAEATDPIVIEAGEAISVSERISVWENNPAWIWVWCTGPQQKTGWVPQKIIQLDEDEQTGTTYVTYNARELTVTAGQELTIEHEESGWFWCRDQQEKRGWVPVSHVMLQP